MNIFKIFRIAIILATILILRTGIVNAKQIELMTHGDAEGSYLQAPWGNKCVGNEFVNGYTRASSGSWGINAHSGSYFWYGGNQSNHSWVAAVYDLRDYAQVIDKGGVRIKFGGYVHTYQDQRDAAELRLVFFSNRASGGSKYPPQNMKYFITDRYTGQQRESSWTYHEIEGGIPTGTRYVEARLESWRKEGDDSDGYLDDVRLTLILPEMNIDNNVVDLGVVTPGKKTVKVRLTNPEEDTELNWYYLAPHLKTNISNWSVSPSTGTIEGESNFNDIRAGEYSDVSVTITPKTDQGVVPFEFKIKFGSYVGSKQELTIKGTIYPQEPVVNIVGPFDYYYQDAATPVQTDIDMESGDQIEVYQWNGPGTNGWITSVGDQRAFNWASVGSHTIYFRVKSKFKKRDGSEFWSNTAEATIQAWDKPEAIPNPHADNPHKLGENVYIAGQGMSIQLNGAADLKNGVAGNQIERWEWSMDNGNDSAFVQNPNYIFPYRNRPYNPRLRVKSDAGIWSDAKATEVKVYKKPTVDVGNPNTTNGKYFGKPNQPLQLFSNVSLPFGADDDSVHYQWTIQSASFDAPNPSYTCTAEGDFIAVLIVEAKVENKLWLASVPDTALIHIEAGIPTANPAGPYSGGIKGGRDGNVQFYGSGAVEQGQGQIDGYLWDFDGDSTTTNDQDITQNPIHSWTEPGSYRGFLKVRTTFGKWSPPTIFNVTIVDGKISGKIKAPDNRTVVQGVIVAARSTAYNLLRTTLTKLDGSYNLTQLPLADYEIIPSKAVAQVSYQLLQNPGAEQGLAGWTVDGFVAGTNPRSGEKCFTGSGDSSAAYQEVDVSNYAADIDNGNGFIHFSGWFYSESRARLFIDVKDENGSSLLVQTLFTNWEESTAWKLLELPLHLPAGTKSVRLGMAGQGTVHFDDLTAKLTFASVVHSFQAANLNVVSLTLADHVATADFIDNSVFPVSGTVRFWNGKPVAAVQVYSGDVIDTTDVNGAYSLGLTVGERTIVASKTGHTFSPATIDTTVTTALAGLDFEDTTMRRLEVEVFDPGDVAIPVVTVAVSGNNGDSSAVTDTTGHIEFVLPPGLYTLQADKYPTATDSLEFHGRRDSVDMELSDAHEIFRVPVPIILEFSKDPGLAVCIGDNGTPDDPVDDPYKFIPMAINQGNSFAYTIKAYADNKNRTPIYGFKCEVVNGVSMITSSQPSAEIHEVDGTSDSLLYTFQAGKPNIADPFTKTLTFKATKQGYINSKVYNKDLIVTGDIALGENPVHLVIPNVVYLILHDPPGDKSYSFFEQKTRHKGMISLNIASPSGQEVGLMPSSAIAGMLGEPQELMDSEGSPVTLFAVEAIGAAALACIPGAGAAAGGTVVAMAAIGGSMMGAGIVGGLSGLGEMSVETKQKLTTSTSSNAQLVGPGKGDVFYGTGFEIALEKIRRLTFDVSDTNNIVPALFDTIGYNIVGTEGSFQYTAYQLKNIVNDLMQAHETAEAAGDSIVADSLLHNVREYEKILLADAGLDNSIDGDDVEQLTEKSIHFGGTTKFDKSLTTAISDQYKISHGIKLSASASSGLKIKLGASFFGSGVESYVNMKVSIGVSSSIGKSITWGNYAQRTVGYHLEDDDKDDDITANLYEDKDFGLPLFTTYAGSKTSDPWENNEPWTTSDGEVVAGYQTTKMVDVQVVLSQSPTDTLSFGERANYQIQVTNTGQRKAGFKVYIPAEDNPNQANSWINGELGVTGIEMSLEVMESASLSIGVEPPLSDQYGCTVKSYPLKIVVKESKDSQIKQKLSLKPVFADRTAPRAIIVCPDQAGFIGGDSLKVEAVTNDPDVNKIRFEWRQKQSGKWGNWAQLGVDTYPDRTNYTVPAEIFYSTAWLVGGVADGLYGLRAVALDTTGNEDREAPAISFYIDHTSPNVQATIPNYQTPLRERIYSGELSVVFTEDMDGNSCTNSTFYVTDDAGNKIAGTRSYNRSNYKALFTPTVPFAGGQTFTVNLTQGITDLADNKLSSEFDWSFKTTTEPGAIAEWMVPLSVTNGTLTDENNRAGAMQNAANGPDAMDIPDAQTGSDLALYFSHDETSREPWQAPYSGKYGWDIRAAGAEYYAWYFEVKAPLDDTVTISWNISEVAPEYQILWITPMGHPDMAPPSFDPADPSELASILSPFGLAPGADAGPKIVDMELNTSYSYIQYSDRQLFQLYIGKALFAKGDFYVGKTGWNLFSVPIQPPDPNPAAVFSDDLGNNFAMFKYNEAAKNYDTYINAMGGDMKVQAGQGYWIHVGQDKQLDILGSYVDLNRSFEISLPDSGWHCFGHPFNFPVALSFCSVVSGNDTIMMPDAVQQGWLSDAYWFYKWQEDHPDSLQQFGDQFVVSRTESGQLNAWIAYWIHAFRDSLSILIPPVPPMFHKNLAKVNVNCSEEWDWYINLTVQNEKGRSICRIGAYKFATDKFDQKDLLLPPTPPNNGVSLELLQDNRRLMWDVRKSLVKNQIKEYYFEVKAEQTVEFDWGDLTNLPAEYQARFIADEIGLSIDMRKQPSCTLPNPGEISAKIIVAFVSAGQYLDEMGRIIPLNYALFQNIPNPFNPNTEIRFQLPENCHVQLTIYNLRGRLVRNLAKEVHEAGNNTITWDGRNSYGMNVASGIYIYQIKANKFVQSRKMILIR